MKRNLISVIIPTYNPQEYFVDVLHSIYQQNSVTTEVIIVDDGSKNKVGDFLQKHFSNFEYTLIRQENKGAPAARNRGAQIASGEYIIFWDDDVIGVPDMLLKMKHALDSDMQTSFAYSSFIFGKKRMQGQPFDVDVLKKINYITTTSLIRTKDFHGFDESLTRFQDWDLWLTLGLKGKTGFFIDEYLFTIIPKKHGMSTWLPKFAYKKPWSYLPGIHAKVQAYERAYVRLVQKHGLED